MYFLFPAAWDKTLADTKRKQCLSHCDTCTQLILFFDFCSKWTPWQQRRSSYFLFSKVLKFFKLFRWLICLFRPTSPWFSLKFFISKKLGLHWKSKWNVNTNTLWAQEVWEANQQLCLFYSCPAFRILFPRGWSGNWLKLVCLDCVDLVVGPMRLVQCPCLSLRKTLGALAFPCTAQEKRGS